MNAEKQEKKIDENVILCGKKSVRTYIESVNVQFEEKGNKEVILKARGKFIITAINVAEFLKRKGDIEVKDIKLGSETFKDEETNKDIYKSTIEIKISKK